MVQQCLCGKEVHPPRTLYCSDTCRRRAARMKRASATPSDHHTLVAPTQKPATPKTQKPVASIQNPVTPKTQKHVTSTQNPVTPKTQKHVTSTQNPVTPKPIALVAKKSAHATLPAASTNKDQKLLMPLGRNMPAKMPLLDAIQRAHDLGYTALQCFISNPDSWHIPLLSSSITSSIAQAISKARISPFVVHAPFIIDLASDKEATWIHSMILLRSTLDQARLIGASDVVVHLNNYKKAFVPVSDKQIKRIVKGIIYSLSDGPSTPNTSIRLLLENGCNPHFSPGSKIEGLGTILKALPSAYQSQVHVCLDTAHCWAAGYDLCNQMDQFLHTVEGSIGLARVRLLHLNDARYERGSTKDEHAQWGKGQISARGLYGIQSLLQDPRLAHITLIMETPLVKNEAGHPDWEQERQHIALVKRILLRSQ